MKRNQSIENWLKPLSELSCQAYLTNMIQVADVLEWILQQVGKSEVWQTTFSISEEFLRRLFFIEKTGLISCFNLVLDHKATNMTVKLWPFILQTIDKSYLADNHSKCLLIDSENGDHVCVITSQNLTRGNRHESAIVTTNEDIFTSLKSQIEDLIVNHSVPLNDIFQRHIDAD